MNETAPSTKNGNAEGRVTANGAPPPAPFRGGLRRLRPSWRLEWPVWASALVRPRLPGTAVLFGRDRFTLVHVTAAVKGAPPRLTHLSSHALPEGSILPGLAELNLKSPAEVAARLETALNALPQRSKLSGISVVLPDGCARVILLTLKDIPTSGRQASQMIRWHIRKRVPFQLDEARVTAQRFPLADGSERVVVALALDRVLNQYEQIIQSLGMRPGLLDLATFNLANLCLLDQGHGSSGDVAILNVADDEFTVMVVRDGVPLFFRSRPMLHEARRSPDEVLRQLNRELITSATYYRERLQEGEQGIRRADLRLSVPGLDALNDLVGQALGVAPGRIDVGSLLDVDAGTEAEAALLERAAPAVGVVLGR